MNHDYQSTELKWPVLIQMGVNPIDFLLGLTGCEMMIIACKHWLF